MTVYRGFAGRTVRGYFMGLWSGAEETYRAWILDAVGRASPESLLDVGCDDGSWTGELRAAAGDGLKRVAGVEIVDEAADAARRRGIEVVQADVNDALPFPDEAFDFVHANQVIEHLVDLDGFVSELRRVLTLDGHALICTENLASWHNVAALVLGYMPFSLTNISRRGAIGNPYGLATTSPADFAESWLHTRVLTTVGLRQLFEVHGFHVVEVFGAGYHPVPASIARWIARKDVRHAPFIGIVAQRSEADA